MGVKKILIFGNPHSGTSIIKSIIGHIDSVHEIYYECDQVEENNYSNDYVVFKCSDVKDKFFGEEYEDHIKIFIVRNPMWVLASYKRRFIKDETKRAFKYSIERYVEVLEKFLECVKNPINNLYTIKYEDIFPNNFAKFRDILDSIGLEYNNTIFCNENKNNLIVRGISYNEITDIPESFDHDRFRTYQINQPFVNNNTTEKLQDISTTEIEMLLKQPTVMELYGNEIIRNY